MLEIAVVSIVMVSISQFLQRTLVDRKAMKENQEKMKEKQRRLKELVGKEDKKSKGEAEKLQKEMLELMGASMQGTMKHMLFTLPIFLGVFWFLSMTYSGVVIELPLAVPVIHRNLSFEITAGISWLWWYIYSSFIMSIVLNIGLKAAGK
jgi:uncharacterized membrane protein (DUF106 family)